MQSPAKQLAQIVSFQMQTRKERCEELIALDKQTKSGGTYCFILLLNRV